MSKACGRGALSAFTVTTTLVCVLLMASPIAATPNPPVKIGGEVVVNTYTISNQFYPDATRRPDKKWIVAWSSVDQDGSGYEGIYMQLYNADRTKYGSEVQVHTHTVEQQIASRVAAASDNTFVVTWYSRHTGTRTVQAQRFSSSGAKVGAEFTVNTGSDHAVAIDVAYLTSGDVVFCWLDRSPGSYRTVIRRYDANFSPLGGPVEVVDDPSLTDQNVPRIASLAGGGFVIVYFGAYAGSSAGDRTEIYGQVYTATATKVGSVFQINTHTLGMQEFPHVEGLPDGGFIVTWSSDGQLGGGYVILARHYAGDGTPIGGEFVVNAPDPQHRYDSRVATFSDNSFAIVWYGLHADSFDIGMQYFDASHNKVGAEMVVNTHATGIQYHAAIASSWDDGEFAVFYSSQQLVGPSTSFDMAAQWFTIDQATTAQVAIPCTSACLQHVCPAGKIMDIKVTGVVSNDVYGSDYFSDDSNVAAAAVFAGLVAAGETGTVTVKCSGSKPSFTSASANGVTTQAYPSSWPSFTFDLGGDTTPQPPPSPLRCYTEPCAGGECSVQGTSFDITVEGVASNNVWGTEAFTDDSWVGAAAVHQGLLEVGSIGSVTVTCNGARASFTGSTQNGVTSNSFGPYDFTYVLHAGPTAPPAPTVDVCVGACLKANCPENRELFLRVYGTTWGVLWGGNAPYTSDTTVSAAAVHAGVLTAGSTGLVKATCTGSQSSFTGSLQNGVITASFGAWNESFVLSTVTTMPTVTCGAGEQCLKDECTVKGRVIKVSVTGSTHSATMFWGVTLFSGDSPLSHAAVHAGLLTDGETSVLYATCQGEHDSFAGSTSNGVTSLPWSTRWPGSYTLSASL